MVLGVSSSSSLLFAPNLLNVAFNRLASVSERLATGWRINRASDDPAGLIAAEELSHELAAMEAATASVERTRAFAQVADSALGSASSLLSEINATVVAAANGTLSTDERDALQLQVDAGLDALTRLGATTLNGNPVFGQTTKFLAGTSPTDVEPLTLPAVDDSLGGSSGVLAALRSGGSASLTSGNLETSAAILDEAQQQLLLSRAEVGAFERYVVDSSQRVLEDMQVNAASALSAVRDADFAAESSNLVRAQILTKSSLLTTRATIDARRAAASLVDNLLG